MRDFQPITLSGWRHELVWQPSRVARAIPYLKLSAAFGLCALVALGMWVMAP